MLYSTAAPLEYTDPIETTGIMTDRTWAELTKAYGYENINGLCLELPANANALDLGAGASNLGHKVATLRPDITWVNFDARYEDEGFLPEDQTKIDRLRSTAPPNLTYVGGNILSPPAQLRVQRFSRIFSYYMFPYVIDYFGKDVAAAAMENALELLTTDGSFSMGPIRYSDSGCWTTYVSSNPSLRDLSIEMITRFTEPWQDVERRTAS